MSENGALSIQLTANQLHDIENSFISENMAVGYKTFNFNPNYEFEINLNERYDEILPECLILSINNYENSNLVFFKIYIDPLVLNFTIGNRNILKIPLAILWNLNKPEIIDNKLYLQLPFDLFFGKINLCGLPNDRIKFNIDYSNLKFL